jgi:hypothetical protein
MYIFNKVTKTIMIKSKNPSQKKVERKKRQKAKAADFLDKKTSQLNAEIDKNTAKHKKKLSQKKVKTVTKTGKPTKVVATTRRSLTPKEKIRRRNINIALSSYSHATRPNGKVGTKKVRTVTRGGVSKKKK